MCEFCNKLEEWEEHKRKYLSERKLSKFDYETYSGLDMSINPEKSVVELYCVLENTQIKPISKSFEIKIRFCPMCGRKLTEE